MRTMNKIVALSLVLAMAFSMMASAASFKDQATINADLVDDINMMVALNVFSAEGTGAGNFEPNTELTRAQVAKLVYVLKNKGVDNQGAGWTGMNIFSDVEEGAWYEGYVNYCASIGMIAGTGNGMFNPNGKMTAVEVAKLLLVLNGYKADIEGYTGDKWFENIVADAEAAGIFVDYELPVRGTVTREWAAKLLNNAINVTKVKYEDGQAVEMYNAISNAAITFKNQDLGISEIDGTLTATVEIEPGATPAHNPNGTNKTSTIKATIGGASKDFTYVTDAALLGQEIKVLFKDATNNGLSADDKVYGVAATGDSKVYEAKVKDITFGRSTTTAGATANVTLKFEGYNDGFAQVIGTVVNGNLADGVASTWANVDMFVNNTSVTPNFQVKYVSGTTYSFVTPLSTIDGNQVVKFIDVDNDNDIDSIFVEQPKFYTVTAINADKNKFTATALTSGASNITLTGGTAQSDIRSFEQYNFVDTVAAKDVVAIIPNYTSGKLVYDVTLVEKVVGNVTKVSGTSYTVNGTAYKPAVNLVSPIGALTVSKNEAEFFVYNGYIVKTNAIATTKYNNLAMVIASGYTNASGLNSAKVEVKVLHENGEIGVYEYKLPTSGVTVGTDAGNALPVERIHNGVSAGTYGSEGIVVEFVENGEGKAYFKRVGDLENVADGTFGYNAGATFTKATQLLTAGTDKMLVNEDTILFVKHGLTDEVKYEVLKASELKNDLTISAMTRYAYSTSTGGAKTALFATVVMSNAELPGAVATDEFVYITSTEYSELVDGKTLYFVDAKDMNGETVKIQIATGTADRNTIYKVGNTASNGNVTLNAHGMTTGALMQLPDATNRVVIDDQVYMIDAETKIMYADTTKSGNLYTTADELVIATATNKDNISFTYETINGVDYLRAVVNEVNGLDLPAGCR